LKGNLVDPFTSDVLWTGTERPLSTRMRAGDPVPWRGGTTTLKNLFGIVANAAGDFATYGLTLNDATGIWIVRDGVVENVVASGDPAPGDLEDHFFESFDAPAFDAAGRIAFRGKRAGEFVGDDDARGIWAGPPDALRLVAHQLGSAARARPPASGFSATILPGSAMPAASASPPFSRLAAR
jgi:hypothetical protein